MSNKITFITIASEVLLNRLFDAKSDGLFKQKLRQKASTFIDELKTIELGIYDNLDKAKSEQLSQVYDIYDGFINKISGVEIYDMENIMYIIEAYNKDPKSINGIVNKVLKQN
jgi:hypothetical protein